MLKNPGRLEFNARIEGDEGSGHIKFPYDVQELYGTKGQVKVNAWFDGHHYRGSIANMGFGHMLGLRKDVRSAIGKVPGDDVSVIIELDTEPRAVDVPADVQAQLDANPRAKEKFEKLSYTHKKEHIRAIEDAKKPETRVARIGKMMGMLEGPIVREPECSSIPLGSDWPGPVNP